MTRSGLPDDTAPLIRVVGVASALTVLVLTVVGATMWTGFVGPGAGPARSDPSSPLGTLARDLTAPSTPAIATEPPAPTWIWADGANEGDEPVTFTRVVTRAPDADRIDLHLSCDNEAMIRIDGRDVVTTDDWATPLAVDLAAHVPADAVQFTIEVIATNHGGPAGVLGTIDQLAGDRLVARTTTDATWRVTAIGTNTMDTPATVVAAYGDGPWGELPGFDRAPLDRGLEVPDGFVVELVYDVPPTQGSWVSLAVDGRGRLITSDQSGGLFRVTPSPLGAASSATEVEPIDLPVGAAQGLLCVDDDLYCMIAGDRADGAGLYRVRDLDGDDRYDDWQRLIALNQGGEHGPHGIALGPDGKLYVVAGNYTRLPELAGSAVPQVWGEDHLLPRLWDARGHAVGKLAPGGWICRLDRDGSDLELVAIGFRNSYDIAFDSRGALFAYDSDMEWDLGAPWYRPTRLVHVVSGADYGWRSGSGKWPSHYLDSVPALLDIGPGSPTGLCFGTDTAFPPRYREAMYALDWTFGTVWALHLEPSGASYTAMHEPFLTGRPLPLADAVANPHDGALYVVLGGRGVRSAIYRVRATDPDRPAGGDAPPRASTVARAPLPAHAERAALEALHRPGASTSDVDQIWPALGHPDRFIAHAARVALEFQPIDLWIDRLRAESDVDTQVQALVALARHGTADLQSEAFAMLAAMPYRSLDVTQRLAWLRAASLCSIRLGDPTTEQAEALRVMLEPAYPAEDPMESRELCAMLIALDSPVVVSRTLRLMERADADADTAPPASWFDETLLARNDTYGSVILKAAAATPQQQQIALALSLREATVGWTPQLRQRYVDWFDSAQRTSGGLSFSGFLDQIREDALAGLTDEERAALERSRPETLPDGSDRPFPQGPGRQWTVDAIVDLTADGLRDRDFGQGHDMFAAAFCAHCHRVAGVGGDAGPDLTAVASRFSLRDLVASIVEPSRVISSQYEQTEFVLDDGRRITGRVVDLDAESLYVQSTPMAPDHRTAVERERIVAQEPSPVSSMMPHLLDALNEDEVLDLLAYLLAEGDARNPMFAGDR